MATEEMSYYPAVNSLLTELGALALPVLTTIPHPEARDGDLPDVAVFEHKSQVLVLPVEVKPSSVSTDALLELPQARRYAESFGGGDVLLTNLWQFIWARAEPVTGELRALDSVQLVVAVEDLDRAHPRLVAGAGTRLLGLLTSACLVHGVITDAGRVAALLAIHASTMAELVRGSGDPRLLLRSVADSLERGLGMRLDDEFFVSTIVQTLVYGLFAAWLDAPDPATFDWRGAAFSLHVPVIAELFHQILDPALVARCDLAPHLKAAARVLMWVDRDAFVAQFDDFAIEYFYEPFLARFDPELRDKLGIWYTPREIAEYQVARADHHLRQDLGIEQGLADENVLVLDPACGTGTYLSAALDFVYDRHITNGEAPALAAGRTRTAALERFIGFEILPAAFLIAHLHLGRHLAARGAAVPPGGRLRVYLTNTLTGWGAGTAPPGLPLPGLESELRDSLAVKTAEPVLVILGNPPYQGYSAADTDEERALIRDWIEPLWRDWGVRKHRLGDLYVRFWRVAVRKIVDLTGRGVVSFITNRKWLGGRSFPAMRERILGGFDRVVVDDLHGDVHDRSHPGDGSVFTTAVAPGIQRGVAITTLIRTNGASPVAEVRRRDFFGPGIEKRRRLREFSLTGIDEELSTVEPTRSNRWRFSGSGAGDEPTLDEYFGFRASGVQAVRAPGSVEDPDRDALAERIRSYFDWSVDDRALFARHPGLGVPSGSYDPPGVREFYRHRSCAFSETNVLPWLYRPFDVRWVYWQPEGRLLHRSRPDLFSCYLTTGPSGELEPVPSQLAIVTAQTVRRVGAARPCVTRAVPSFDAVDPNSRVFPRLMPRSAAGAAAGSAATPLPLLGASEPIAYRHNVRDEWIAAARAIGVEGTDIEVGDVVFYALVAVMHSPEWAGAIGTDNDDFPGVPLPANVEALRRAERVGHRISDLADPTVDIPGITSGRIDPRLAGVAVPDATSERSLAAGNPDRGGLYVDDGGGVIFWDESHGWRGVPRAVWEYSVGGFPVIPRWLGYRHRSRDGYMLSDRDIEQVTMLCRRIMTILELEEECDRVFEEALAITLEPPVPGSGPS